MIANRPLTVMEEAIARLAARGRTNDEIATALHVSPKTVEWNLTKIYRVLDVRSRTELAALWASAPSVVTSDDGESPGVSPESQG